MVVAHRDMPPTLLGERWHESNDLLLYGYVPNYVIVDRMGTTIEIIPSLSRSSPSRDAKP